MDESVPPERLKFFGPRDLANGWAAEPAVALIREYSAGRKIHSLNDALELHNALAFEEYGILPSSLDQQEREILASSSRESRREVASFFSGFDASNVETFPGDFEFQYADDLIFLLERHGVDKKVGGQALFDALMKARVPLAIMLANRQFVKHYDRRLREALLADARNGELLVSKRMIKDPHLSYEFPASFSGEDSQQLLRAYIESPAPHPNHIQAIAEAMDNEGFGLTPKVRLQAKRRYDVLVQELFANDQNSLLKNGYGVQIDPEQREPVIDKIDHEDGGTTHLRSFGGEYLMSSIKPARVLKNFATVVGYLDLHGLLAMPSRKGHIGVLDALRISGKDSYPRGQVFKYLDSLTILGTHLYSDFLRRNGVEVEEVVAWFFREHLINKYGAANLYYTPSSPNGAFLERCRHLSAEMESVARQFALYCDEGELDPELLRMTSSPRPWAEIPSLVENKYLYSRPASDCDQALALLFSDQSRLTYINEELKARTFEELVTENELRYDALHPAQKDAVDWLISEGLVAVDVGVVDFAQPVQILVLSDIHERESVTYSHYGVDESAAALALVEKGWLAFRSTLLTSAESSYFNFFLNKSEFSDGPDLRNKYAHGTNADPEDVAAHRQAYGELLRMLVSLVLKIHNDFQASVMNRATSVP